jgi:hypothetical protein
VRAADQPSSGPKRGARARMHYFAKEPPVKQVFTRRNVHYFARDDLRTKHLGKAIFATRGSLAPCARRCSSGQRCAATPATWGLKQRTKRADEYREAKTDT